MFIFYGYRTKLISEVEKTINEKGLMRPATILIYQKYAHLFWIPLFPIGRNYLLHFTDTGESYTKTLFQKMPEKYLEICKEVSRDAKTPWWTFIGIIIFGLLIFWLESSSEN